MCRGDIERSTFESETADLLFRTESRLLRVIKDAGLTVQQVDEVIAVGGSSRMPQVLDMLRRVTGKEPNCSLSPDEAIAHGAAIYAAMHVAGELPVQVESKKGDANDSEAATDDGDASHAGAGLFARLSSPLLKLLRSIRASNVTAHSLGVVVEDSKGRRRVSRLIERNTALPAAAAKYYATVTADQKRVSVQVVEGESEDVADCILIGACSITDLPKGLPRGSPVQVHFAYDRSGRLDVRAVHVTSGTWAQTRIDRDGGLDTELIEINQDLLQRLVVA
jgi:molecular chaperone DnaK